MGVERRLGVVTVFALLFLFLLVFFVALFDGLQLERAGGDDFKIGTTLGTRDHFPFVDLFFFDVKIVFAFRTEHHIPSLAY